MWCPRSLKRAVLSPAPRKTRTAVASTSACPARHMKRLPLRMSVTRSHRSRLHSRGRCHADRGGIRHQANDGSEHDHQQSRPDPGDQRIQVRLDDGPACILIYALVDQVQIADQEQVFFNRGVDSGYSLGLLAGLVESPLRIQSRNLPAPPDNVNDGPLVRVVLIVFLRVRLAYERVSANINLVPETHLLLWSLSERSAGNADDHHGHPEVHDVPTVAASVPVPQVHHRGEQILAGVARNHAASSHKL